ncbi:MAG: hypothetical protein Fur0021_39300 [Candidatus Promineifilaceae bacterium]
MKRFSAAVTLLFLLLLPAVAWAAPAFSPIVIEADEVVNDDLQLFSDNLTVEAGAVVNGNITVVGGNAEVAGSVNGDITVMGGSVTLDGQVAGNLTVFGGNLDIGENADVKGECITLGGNVTAATETGFSCTSASNFPLPFLGTVPPAPPVANNGAAEMRNPTTVSRFAGLLGRTLLLGGLAWLVASVWPAHLGRVKQAARQRTAASGVVGLLTTAAVASLAAIIAVISTLLLLVCVGLLGYPVLFAMLALFALAGALGWIAMGSILGERLLQNSAMQGNRLMNTTVAGTALLTFGLGLLQLLPAFLIVPILAGLATFVVFSIGLGAATLTLFGRHPYPAETASAGGSKIDDVLATLPEK